MTTRRERGNQPAEPSLPREVIPTLIGLLCFFLVLYFVTISTESGDTLRYAGDVVHHSRGESVQFWEFGHLLWRPWGAIGLHLLGSWFEQQFGDTDVQAVARFFVFTNFICSVLTLVLIWDLLRRLASARLAILVAVAFCGANCFLDYVAVGSAYLPALCFECAALWFAAKSATHAKHALTWASLAGLSYAVSVLLWFPYIFAGLGMLVFLLLWPFGANTIREVQPAKRWSSKIPQGTAFLVSFAIASIAVFGAGAAANGVHGLAQIRQWIIESDSGWSQHLNLVRAATGIPRSLYELASDTTLLKRWFFHDPYNPVHLSQLAGALFLKLALFYSGVAALLWILIWERSARAALLVFLSASVPLLFFAIFVFEPGSTSRYLPLLPFLYLAAAVALVAGRSRRIAYAGVVALLVSALVLNVYTLTHGSSALAAQVRNQKSLLDQQITGHALVFIPTLHEAFYYLPLTRPVDHRLSSSKYQTVDVVEIASLRLLHWRAEFADRALNAWKDRQEVWISQHVYAQSPRAAWAWVEGDDARIKWAELPSFFAQFQTDRITNPGEDGFRRLTDSQVNRSALEHIVAEDPKYSRSQITSSSQ